jgi:prepilin-type N-terminal cleavage/methylation domain-containing protein
MTRLMKLTSDGKGHTRLAAADGFTIIELMISMILLAVVSTSFLAATNSIYNGIHKQQGVVDASDGNRRALELLDKQVRYASAINAPATAADGNFYVEYQWSKSDNSTDTLTCSQWRLNPTTDVLQWRSWRSGTVPSVVPAWTTVDTGVVNVPSTAPPFALLPTTQNGVVMQYQELGLNLIAKRDKGNVTTVSTLTALNTPNSALPTTAVCQEVARS